ncbi:MAG: ATP-binding protein [Prochlorotrichaceae cyanobacterium]
MKREMCHVSHQPASTVWKENLMDSLCQWILDAIPCPELFDRLAQGLVEVFPEKTVLIYYTNGDQDGSIAPYSIYPQINHRVEHRVPSEMPNRSLPPAVVQTYLAAAGRTIALSPQSKGWAELCAADSTFAPWFHQADIQQQWGVVFGFPPSLDPAGNRSKKQSQSLNPAATWGILVVEQGRGDGFALPLTDQNALGAIALQLSIAVQHWTLRGSLEAVGLADRQTDGVPLRFPSQSQPQFEKMLRNIPGAVYQFVMTPDRRFYLSYMSDRITDLLGLTARDVEIDVSLIMNRVHPDDRLDRDRSILESAQTLNPWIWEGRFQHLNGQYRWLRGMSQPSPQANGTIVWDGILLDITLQKEADEKIKNALKRQEKLSELRTNLITTISHEIRVPLTVLVSSVGILRDFSHRLPQEKQVRHLQTIETYVQHITRLLEDLSFLNPVDVSQQNFEPDVINLIEFFSRLVDELSWSNGKYPMQLETEFQGVPTDPALAIACVDVKLLRQILTNLMTNAVKYSDSQALIHVILILTPHQFILKVKDSGIGIPLADQASLFEPFYRGKNVGSRSGTGLGLSIVKTCVDRHKGSISVVSHPGQGSLFTVVLPRSPQGGREKGNTSICPLIKIN